MSQELPTSMPCRGCVRWFNVKKGYGFIQNAAGEDVFVHFTTIEGDGFRFLKCGDPVTFEVQRGPRGLFARNVQKLLAEVPSCPRP